MKEQAERDVRPEGRPKFLIALGASAGGVESLIEFFGAVPTDLDAAFLVILHRSPDAASALGEVLGHNTALHIVSEEGEQSLQKRNVYLAPPRGVLEVTREKLVWTFEVEDRDLPLPAHPIDHALISVAECFGENAVAIILSGSGSDAAMGAASIKAHGGLVLVEDPDRAAFQSMPRTACERTSADVVGAPGRLAAVLRDVLSLEGKPLEAPEQIDEEPIEACLRILKKRSGYDFRSYRRATVERRVLRRIALSGVKNPSAYVELLGARATERDALCRDLLINVTSFFRDPDSFSALDRLVIVPLAEDAQPDHPIRVWVPGCATGEEAYTIAMLLARALERKDDESTFQIFATDLDAQAIETASQGVYPHAIESHVPEPLLRRYMTRLDTGYRVHRALRERMVFAVHDLTQDPPFTRMDLVSCRNLMIYLRSELQRHVLQVFGYALNDDGHLMLGASEATVALREFFEPVDAESRIYRRNETVAVAPRMHSLDALLREHDQDDKRQGVFETGALGSSVMQAAVVEHLIKRDAEFALALDDEQRLKHVYGDPGNALRVPSGGITTDISSLTRGEFKTAILSGVPRAHRSGEDVFQRSVAVDGADGVASMDVQIIPMEGPVALRSLILVRPTGRRALQLKGGNAGQMVEAEIAADLERELHSTRDQLTETVEALEVSNEELQTSNEQLLASNEELQSTNEELQSTNEELHTVNAEHQEKILRLTEVTRDLENVLLNGAVGTILLDRDLCIHRFTQVATEVVHLMEPDHGRPLHHITHSLIDVDLSAVVQAVRDSGAGREDTVRTKDGRSFLMRCQPLRDDAGHVEGVMLTFADVTTLERVTDELRRSERRFLHVMENVDQAIFLRRRDDEKIEFVSQHVVAIFSEKVPADLEGVLEYVHPDDVEIVRDAFAAPSTFSVEVDFRMGVDDSGGDRWFHCSLRPTDDERGADGFDVGYLFDITARKRSEIALRQEVDRFEGFVNAIPDRFFWRGLDGEWQRLRSLMPGREVDESKYPPLSSIVTRSALRAIDAAADAALEQGTLQTIGFDAHNRQGSRSFEARLLMVTGQGVICALRDVSELRRSERELVTLTRNLEQEANSDHLTRLPNRRGLEKVLFTELERCRRLGSRLCAILVDCDNFKRVNDTMGHATGDVVLQEVGKRLRGVVRPSDTIGRVGGDEFLVLLPDTRHAEAMQLAERLRLAITGSPLTSGRDVIGITGSLGVATVPLDLVSVEEVISLTQHALAHSKKVGKNRVTSHEYSDLDTVDPRDELLNVLESGRGFRTFAQPILDLQTGQIDGYELLTRGPGGALESPADIFQLSSENNILTSVDLHCVKRSVGWARDHLDRGRFHVNLFPSTILDTPAARLLAVFGDPGLLRHFCVEISEQQFIGDPMYLKPHVEELRREGARIALDDVGFGRSSLESLLLLEPETVKLDKSVVHGAFEDAAKRRTLERLVGVIRGIDADIVAEGIETESDRELLIDLGVEFGQGYLFGRPSESLLATN